MPKKKILDPNLKFGMLAIIIGLGGVAISFFAISYSLVQPSNLQIREILSIVFVLCGIAVFLLMFLIAKKNWNLIIK